MKYSEFVGQVHHRAEMASENEAVRAIRATLQTLGERLFGGEPGDLAAQLPQEIGAYLAMGDGQERFGFDEFLKRVAKREGVDLPVATYHARVVVDVLKEAVTPGEIEDALAQLPETYNALFEAGSEGGMETR